MNVSRLAHRVARPGFECDDLCLEVERERLLRVDRLVDLLDQADDGDPDLVQARAILRAGNHLWL